MLEELRQILINASKYLDTHRMDNDQLLYSRALTFLNTDASPSDEAPDELGCADTVEEIYFAQFAHYVAGGPKTLSTATLYNKLRHSSDWEKTLLPTEGAIIISPTGFSHKGSKHGHVGIVGKNGIIMSNNSFRDENGVKGTFIENFTFRSWQGYYRDRLGFPVYIFKQR